MAYVKLHASPDFFKLLSLEFQQQKLIVHYLETFVLRAKERGHDMEDSKMLLILDQLEFFISMTKGLSDRVEKILHIVVITD